MLVTFLRPRLGLNSKSLCQARCLWTYVAKAFNQVDSSRLELVGPDRLCAEWVLKNSGAVAFTITPGQFLRDYNALPPENVRLQVKEIDGTDSSLMRIGFDHLKGCKKVDTIILVNCKNLEDAGLEGLVHARGSLKHLQVSKCDNLMDECLMVIKELTNLDYLKISDMKYVKNIEKVGKELAAALPNCKMEIS